VTSSVSHIFGISDPIVIARYLGSPRSTMVDALVVTASITIKEQSHQSDCQRDSQAYSKHHGDERT
jgi:hypothetical protein